MSRQNRNTKNSKKSDGFSASPKSQNSPRKSAQKSTQKGAGGKKQRGGSSGNKNASAGRAGTGWIWGQHAVMAALTNSARKLTELRVTPSAAAKLNMDAILGKNDVSVSSVTPAALDNFLPNGAAHQGFALQASPPPDCDIETLAAPAKGIILVLDKVTDPQNVGAMFRLASAFNARGIIMQDRSAPPMAGATTKVAVGAVESVPHALVTNIANTLDELKQRGWMVTGLAGEAELTITQAFALPKNATHKANVIVMGAEGPGLRPRVRSMCDQLAKIPMPGSAQSLNVSTAAAIAIYEASKPVQ